MKIVYLLMGGKLGNESNIDVLLGSSATSPQVFASIGNDDFVAKFVLKNTVAVFEFPPITRRDRVGIYQMS